MEAMFHYTHGIKLDPRNAYLYSNRSLAFLRMQQYYHALEDAKTTIQLRPNWAKVYHKFTYSLDGCKLDFSRCVYNICMFLETWLKMSLIN